MRTRRPWTDKDIAELQALWKAGESVMVIAIALGRTETAVVSFVGSHRDAFPNRGFVGLTRKEPAPRVSQVDAIASKPALRSYPWTHSEGCIINLPVVKGYTPEAAHG